MKRRGILLVISIFLSVIIGRGGMQVLAADEKPAELIVLMDTSLSLDGESINQEIQWMQKICSVSLGSGIQVNFLTFDAPQTGGEETAKTLLEWTEITEENLASSLEAVSKISHGGKYTDLKGALNEAVAILEGRSGSRQYIMILSDGRLDYDNIRDEDRLKTEAPARVEFCEAVKRFAGRQGCGIILVEFGGGASYDPVYGADAAGDARDAGDSNGESDFDRFEQEINLFRELEGEAGVIFFQGDSALSDAASSIFRKMGYPIDSIAAQSLEDGEITFTLDQDYEYTIIHLIQRKPEVGTQIEKEDFRIWYKNQERAIDQIQLLSNSAFVFLEKSTEGRYSIDLPEGRGEGWNYEVISRKKERVDSIYLSLWQDDMEDDAKSSEEFYVGNIILHMELEGELDAASNPLLSYRLNHENEGFKNSCLLESPAISGQGRVQEKAIFIEKTGNYQIQVFGPDESVSSNIVSFIVYDKEKEQETEPEEAEKTVLVGDEIALRRMFNFEENERVTFCVDGGNEQNINEQMEKTN